MKPSSLTIVLIAILLILASLTGCASVEGVYDDFAGASGGGHGRAYGEPMYEGSYEDHQGAPCAACGDHSLTARLPHKEPQTPPPMLAKARLHPVPTRPVFSPPVFTEEAPKVVRAAPRPTPAAQPRPTVAVARAVRPEPARAGSVLDEKQTKTDGPLLKQPGEADAANAPTPDSAGVSPVQKASAIAKSKSLIQPSSGPVFKEPELVHPELSEPKPLNPDGWHPVVRSGSRFQ